MFFVVFFFFKQKTAYEMRISDWSSDVCSSDLVQFDHVPGDLHADTRTLDRARRGDVGTAVHRDRRRRGDPLSGRAIVRRSRLCRRPRPARRLRSEEHTSELQSLMPLSYAVFCLRKTATFQHGPNYSSTQFRKSTSLPTF